MNLIGNVSDLVLKRVVNSDLGEVSLDSNMLNTLMQIDGVKTLEEIANQLNVDMSTLKQVVARLDSLNLVELDNETIPTLNDHFFDQLAEHLAVAMGPMAEILIEDEIQAMGIDRNEIPTHLGAELVDILAREIPRDEKKIKFQQTMLKSLKSM